jgi:tetratricopeptide (TPR) repeat protein
VWLEPLAAADSARLVGELPGELREAVVDRGGGNPFFVEELVSSLLDRGALRRANGGWVAGDSVDWETVPDTVQAVLAARIDLLDDDAKSALQAASVMGRAFWRTPLGVLLDAEPELGALEDRDFVRRRAGSTLPGDVEYVFKHALTREVAYASLSKAARAGLHARFGDWLEAWGGGRDEHAMPLAHHFAEAARPEDADLAWAADPETGERVRQRAVRWLGRAGELAVSRYELEEGIALLERAVALEHDPERLAALWREIGRAHAFRYDGAGLRDAMQRSLELTSDPAGRADTLAELAYHTSFRSGMFSAIPSAETLDGWVDEVLESPDARAASRAKALIARVYWRDHGGVEEAREATEVASALGDAGLRSAAARARGYAALQANDFSGAYAATRESLEFLDAVGNHEEAVEATEQLAIAAAALGRVDEARDLVTMNSDLVQPLSPHHRVHGIALVLEMATLFGEWDAIRDERARTVRLIDANRGTPCGRHANAYYMQALAHEHCGDSAEARRLDATAAQRLQDAQSPNPSVIRAMIALARGDLDEALVLIGDPDALRTVQGWWWYSLPSTIAYLDVHTAAGARDAVERKAVQVRDGGCPILQPFATRALGRVRGDDGLVREAVAEFEAFGLTSRARETAAG